MLPERPEVAWSFRCCSPMAPSIICACFRDRAETSTALLKPRTSASIPSAPSAVTKLDLTLSNCREDGSRPRVEDGVATRRSASSTPPAVTAAAIVRGRSVRRALLFNETAPVYTRVMKNPNAAVWIFRAYDVLRIRLTHPPRIIARQACFTVYSDS
jgi:hypothetical protein